MFKRTDLPEVTERTSDSAWAEFDRLMQEYHAAEPDDGFPDTVPMEYVPQELELVPQPVPKPIIDWDKVTLEPLKPCRRF